MIGRSPMGKLSKYRTKDARSTGRKGSDGDARLIAFAEPYFRSAGSGKTFAVIGFRDLNGRKEKVVVPASHLVETSAKQLIAHLANEGYRWRDPQEEAKALSASDTDKRIFLTPVPGWHDSAYIRPYRRER